MIHENPQHMSVRRTVSKIKDAYGWSVTQQTIYNWIRSGVQGRKLEAVQQHPIRLHWDEVVNFIANICGVSPNDDHNA